MFYKWCYILIPIKLHHLNGWLYGKALTKKKEYSKRCRHYNVFQIPLEEQWQVCAEAEHLALWQTTTCELPWGESSWTSWSLGSFMCVAICARVYYKWGLAETDPTLSAQQLLLSRGILGPLIQLLCPHPWSQQAVKISMVFPHLFYQQFPMTGTGSEHWQWHSYKGPNMEFVTCLKATQSNGVVSLGTCTCGRRSAFDKRPGPAAKVIPAFQTMTLSSQHGKLQLNKQIPVILSKRPLWTRHSECG